MGKTKHSKIALRVSTLILLFIIELLFGLSLIVWVANQGRMTRTLMKTTDEYA